MFMVAWTVYTIVLFPLRELMYTSPITLHKKFSYASLTSAATSQLLGLGGRWGYTSGS